MNKTMTMFNNNQEGPNNTNPSGFNKLRLRLEKGNGPTLNNRRSSSNLDESTRRPSFFTKPSIMSLHRRQKSVDEVIYDTQHLQLSKSRSRSTSPKKFSTFAFNDKSNNINDTPEMQSVSNFSSPTKSILSSDCSNSESPILDPECPQVSIPRINITEPVDSIQKPGYRTIGPKESISKFGRFKKKTISMLFDQGNSLSLTPLTPLTPIQPASEGQNSLERPKLSKSHSENGGDKSNTNSSVDPNDSLSGPNAIKIQQDLTRKRSKTMGSVENDLYHKRNGSIVKTIGSMMMLKPKSSNLESGSASVSQVSLDSEPQTTSRPQTPPKVCDGDTPEQYVDKLVNEGFNFEITSILSLSDSDFLKDCLTHYICGKFDFHDVPLDIALRQLLMYCELPKEAQQIDRVLNSFSLRYYQCNLELWDNSDQIYFLAFSFVMLHTDYYNINNKKKMTKEEFVKNTKIDSDETISNSFLTKEILEYFYDNIIYTKFVKNHQLYHSPSPQPLYSLPKRIFSSTSSTNLEGMNHHPSTPNLRSQSFSSTTSQIFSSAPVIDPYQIILNDQLDSLKLDLSSIHFENPFSDSFRSFFKEILLAEVRERMLLNKGLFIRYNKDCNWLSSKIEIQFKNADEIEYGKRVLLKVIKVAEIFREEIIVNSKFFTIGSTSRVIWKKYYGFLTTCGFFLFDTLNFLSVADRERIYKNDFGDEPFVVDILLDFILKSCLKYSLNGLFACHSPKEQEHDTSFHIFSTNKKEAFCTNTEEELSSWISSINYIAALDSCFIDTVPENNHEVAPLRSISMEEKITKLEKNKAASIIKINYFLKIIQHIQTLTPFSHRTRDSLIAHYKSIGIKIDWLWYEIERNIVYTNILRHELIITNDRFSTKTNDEESFLEGSFINDDFYQNSKKEEEGISKRTPLRLISTSNELDEVDGEEGDFVDASD